MADPHTSTAGRWRAVESACTRLRVPVARLSRIFCFDVVVPALRDGLARQVDHGVHAVQALFRRRAFHGIPNVKLHSGRQVGPGVPAQNPQLVVSAGERFISRRPMKPEAPVIAMVIRLGYQCGARPWRAAFALSGNAQTGS
jgi:hypothetical protein